MGWIILLPNMLVVQAVFLLTGLSAAKADKGLVLGVRLPKEALEDGELVQLLSGFRKGLLLHSLGFLPMACLLSLLEEYGSWMLSLFLLWTITYLFTFGLVFRHWADKLRKLKNKKGWDSGEEGGIIAVDTQVIGAKGRMALPLWWMLPPLAISAVPLFCCLVWREREDMYIFAAVILTLQGAFWFCRWSMGRRRSTAYCADPDINRACHYLAIRGWSICWAVVALAFALFMNVAFFFLRNGMRDGSIALLILPPVLILITAIFYTDRRIRKGQNQLLAGQLLLKSGDEDQYWTPSGLYNNPHDPLLMVEKRWGIGMTLNIGHPAGRWIGKGLILLVTLGVSVLLFMLAWMELAPFSMEIQEETVSISAPFYGTSFSMEEIESVALSDTIPDGNKTNGMATGSVLLGYFRLEEVGPARLYVRRKNMPCLIIQLPNETIYFTGKTEEETRALYEILSTHPGVHKNIKSAHSVVERHEFWDPGV